MATISEMDSADWVMGQPQEISNPRKRKSFEWSGAICKTCYRPIVGACDQWRHLDGRIPHPVVVRELSR
jgi:hypothetical protein